MERTEPPAWLALELSWPSPDSLPPARVCVVPGRLQEAEAQGQAVPRSVVNISSTTGTHGNAGQANYATAKAGVVGLTKSIAKEW